MFDTSAAATQDFLTRTLAFYHKKMQRTIVVSFLFAVFLSHSGTCTSHTFAAAAAPQEQPLKSLPILLSPTTTLRPF